LLAFVKIVDTESVDAEDSPVSTPSIPDSFPALNGDDDTNARFRPRR
jgi:hypothetical protein